jgi:hypothetical protein
MDPETRAVAYQLTSMRPLTYAIKHADVEAVKILCKGVPITQYHFVEAGRHITLVSSKLIDALIQCGGKVDPATKAHIQYSTGLLYP